jgi:hypothetical protein
MLIEVTGKRVNAKASTFPGRRAINVDWLIEEMSKLAFKHRCPRGRQQAQRTGQRAGRALRDEINGILGLIVSVPLPPVPDINLPSQPITKDGGASPKHIVKSRSIGLEHVFGEYPQHIHPS